MANISLIDRLRIPFCVLLLVHGWSTIFLPNSYGRASSLVVTLIVVWGLIRTMIVEAGDAPQPKMSGVEKLISTAVVLTFLGVAWNLFIQNSEFEPYPVVASMIAAGQFVRPVSQKA